MKRPRRGPSSALRAVVLLALLSLAAPASAEGYRSFESDYAACRELVKRRKWAEAVEAYRKLFRDHEGEARVLERLRDIEEDLKRSMFMTGRRSPDGKALFGDQVASFNTRTRHLHLKYTEGPRGPFWTRVGKTSFYYEVRFAKKVAITVGRWASLEEDQAPLVLLCYDIEKEGGYIVCPGTPRRMTTVRGRPGWTQFVHIISKSQGGAHTTLFRGSTILGRPFTVERQHSRIITRTGRTKIASVHDQSFSSGFLGFTNLIMKELTIKGTVDKAFYRQVRGAHEDLAFREFMKEKYDRDRVLPAWVRKAPKTKDVVRAPVLPADATPELAKTVAEPLRKALEVSDEDAARALLQATGDAAPLTRLWLFAVARYAKGEHGRSREALDRLLTSAPDFYPAIALRGRARLRLRDLDGARADIALALEKAPDHWLSYWTAVSLAIFDGKLDNALARLREAKQRGVTTEGMRILGDIVHRAHRGPLWSAKHAAKTKHFDVTSDHSKKICSEMGKLLEMAQWRYAKYFPNVTLPERRARVRIFSTRGGYVRYAFDKGADLRMTAGAYQPSIRELLLFIPLDRRQLRETLRHEGFHRFIHELLDDIPIWFDEGYAEFFGNAKEEKGGGFEAGAVCPHHLEVLKKKRADMVSLERLFLMSHERFMKDAAVRYAQAWLVVHFLEDHAPKALEHVLRDYFLALRNGKSAKEAYAQELKPHLAEIERGVEKHRSRLGSMSRWRLKK